MPECSCYPGAQNLALLSLVIRDVARLHRLARPDADDFGQTVHLKFIERNYDVFTRFRGDSSLRTYLTTVVTRALLDWRNARYGKWRPSAAATRLGPDAVRLDRWINRDGYTPGEAVELAHQATGASIEALRTLAAALPRRAKSRLLDAAHLQQAPSQAFEDPVEARQRRQRDCEAQRALGQAYRQLPLDEQRLLSLRYRSRLSVRQISETLHTDQKALYRQFDRVVSKLRHALAHHPVFTVTAPLPVGPANPRAAVSVLLAECLSSATSPFSSSVSSRPSSTSSPRAARS
jgi:RNA polymerase sigma factor (sigma-70 family)